MKAKAISKKILAAVLVIAVLVVSVPLSGLFASAVADTNLPTIGTQTDYADKIKFSDTTLDTAYKADGEVTLSTTTYPVFGGYEPTEGGSVVIQAKLTFNGNVDFSWDTANSKYNNGWGKYGIRIGTYTNGDVRPVIVSFRRCTATAYLFDSYNSVLGTFGGCASTTVESLVMTVKYDSAAKEVSLWIDGTYINTISVASLSNFKFDMGFAAQGLGNTYNSATGTTTPNTITFSEVSLFGDLQKVFDRAAYPEKEAGMVEFADRITFSAPADNDSFKNNGKVTVKNGGTANIAGVEPTEDGYVVIKTKYTFNGNVDYSWVGVGGSLSSWQTDANDGRPNDGYCTNYGKVAVKLGTAEYGGTKHNIYVAYRRNQGVVYIFDDGNATMGVPNITSSAPKDVDTLEFTVRYDKKRNEVSVWLNGTYAGTSSLDSLSNFAWAPGYHMQGIGNTAVDPSADPVVTTPNTVTVSDISIYGEARPDASALPVVDDYEDWTDKFYLNDGGFEKDRYQGGFTLSGTQSVTGSGIILKENGVACMSATLVFNGNVDFSWDAENNKYNNGWGKYGIQIGTYMGEWNGTPTKKPVIVSFRRCTGAAYLFDNANKVLGQFGSCGSTTVEEIDMTVKYDSKAKKVHLWIDGLYVSAVDISGLDDFNFLIGYQVQGTGNSYNAATGTTTPNSVTFKDIKVFGDLDKDPNFIMPELEPMTENLAEYIELIGGTSYFERKFSASSGTYTFGGIETEDEFVYHLAFDFVINERGKQANGTDMPWAGPRFHVMEANGFKYQLSFMEGSTQLLANGGGYAGYNAPTAARANAVGEKHSVIMQYDYKTNRFSVWYDGELVIRAAELPETNGERSPMFGVLFESCSVDISNLKIWGSGLKVSVTDEYKELLNNPFFNSASIPTKPTDNINYWQYMTAYNSKGDLAFDLYLDEFATYWSEETGTVAFQDSYGNRNLNGITNGTTFVMNFTYRVNEDDPDWVAAKKQTGSSFQVRAYNLPTSQGKKNNYEIQLLNNAVKLVVHKDDSVKATYSSTWNREVGKEYDVSIVSAPTWCKVFIDGKLMLVATGLFEYVIDFRYTAVHASADFWNVQVYDVLPDEATEPVKNNAQGSVLTGATINAIEHNSVPLATEELSIWIAVAGGGAILCLAGFAVVTVVFLKKRKTAKTK